MTDKSKTVSRRTLLGGMVGAGLAMPVILNSALAESSLKGMRVGYSTSLAANEWMVAQRRGVIETSAKHGFELSVVDANDRPSKQVQDIEDLVVRRMDAIIINTYYADAITPAVKQINEAGIPLVVLSSSLASSVEWTAHLATDNLGTSTRAGHIYAEKLNGKGKVILIEGKTGSFVNEERTRGWRSVIDKNPEIEIVGHAVANYERGLALRKMEEFLNSQRDIDAVYCNNDEMALGVLQAVREAGRERDIWITGYDGVQPDIMHAIAKGEIFGTFHNSPMGVEGVEVVAKILRDEPVDKRIVFQSPFINAENLAEFWDPESGMKMRPSQI
ncbi:substrate-binding domain-containing protein [Hoeflea sp. G2-23]|uniref:Substrate-binding domain-containing protein n=1 Tax=Hoeflea algicola TaxID=2983763 RepID=A0ABT3ZDD2_9HYPH|nr:substrate-binding domain-containing protein [Hoeflea algicola]MCY0149820.1 substrate-binding domain-containing protein [Hoeflea algicola]